MAKQTDELNILFPNINLKINGEKIEVKEYSLEQQLQHRAKFMPFVSALRTTLEKDQTEFGLDPLMNIISEHYKDVLSLVAISINKPVQFVESLKGEDADNLLMTWWAVNSDFFTRKAVQPLLERMARETLNGVKS